MTVRVQIPARFQKATKGADMVEVNGNTASECLNQLVQQFPQMGKMLLDENGKLSRYIMIFVNRESIQEKGLARPVKDGDVIYPMMMIGGG